MNMNNINFEDTPNMLVSIDQAGGEVTVYDLTDKARCKIADAFNENPEIDSVDMVDVIAPHLNAVGINNFFLYGGTIRKSRI